MSSTGETYKPSEHGGLKEDGTPDKRMQQTEFAYGKSVLLPSVLMF